MKSTCVFVVWLSLSHPAAVAAQDMGAVRALDPSCAEALYYGHDGSEAFRDLIAEIGGVERWPARLARTALGGQAGRRQAALASRPR